ncbi:MAG: hypothetical protein ABEJ72_00940 [Candidatus Aenigmatarchaeota archaeon]
MSFIQTAFGKRDDEGRRQAIHDPQVVESYTEVKITENCPPVPGRSRDQHRLRKGDTVLLPENKANDLIKRGSARIVRRYEVER